MTRVALAWPGLTGGGLVGAALAGIPILALGAREDAIVAATITVGAIGGAASGIAIAWHLTRPRLPP
jgi:hypothetical protein